MGLDRLSTDIQAIVKSWAETKEFVERSLAFSLDSLHVIAGVLILLTAALLIRKPVTNWQPWLVVLVLTCTNEIADLWSEQWPSPGRQYGEGVKDLLLTMLLPTVLLLASRRFPRLFDPGTGSAAAADNSRQSTN